MLKREVIIPKPQEPVFPRYQPSWPDTNMDLLSGIGLVLLGIVCMYLSMTSF